MNYMVAGRERIRERRRIALGRRRRFIAGEFI